jgi:CRP/FNR family transcriptional regulator, cyclic AMP receptor protein
MTGVTLFKHNPDFQHFKDGQVIFEEGQPGDFMYVIVEGKVDIIVRSKLIATAQAQEVIGEMALLNSKTRSATCIARTDCKLVPVSLPQFSFMVQETPYFAIQVLQTMAERLRLANEHVRELLYLGSICEAGRH